jgi:type IV secretion system protein VirB8
VAEAAALASLAPTVRVEPVFVYLRDDGTAITSRSWSDMPENVREMNMVNVVAEYVRLREGWSSGEAQRAWNVVSALSTKEVRGQFQADYARSNPQSFERLYGDKASLRVDVVNVEKDADRLGAYRVYFNRVLRTGDQDGRPEAMVATLRVRDVLNPKALPRWQRVQFNGPAIAVWEYPGATHTTPNLVNGAPR